MKNLNRDSTELGSFISGCLSNDKITDGEKVILMRLGLLYGEKLSSFTNNENKPDISGCKSVVQVCYKLNLPIHPDIIELIKSRLSTFIILDRINIDFMISREILINLIRYLYLINKRNLVLGILELKGLFNYKKWTCSIIRQYLDRSLK